MKRDHVFRNLALLLGALPLLTSVAFGGTVLLNGAGATFPYPIYSKWFDLFAKVEPGVRFNYQSIGSGGGIRQITEKTVDFGATDGPMTDDQLWKVSGALLHFPTVLGGDVAAYNIPEVREKLNFTQKALVGIFTGTLTRWNDPELARVNPGATLPDKPIILVHRSDGSGTTYIWTDFLSKVSPEWEKKVGRSTSVNWPVGIGGKGNEGVSGLVKQTPYSIGYVEWGYAIHSHLTFGLIENAEGEFVDCTVESITKAASAAVKTMPSDFRVSITNAPGKGAYPAASFTWLLIYREQENAIKGEAIIKFLHWMLHEGQRYAPDLGYAPLPEEVISMVEKAIDKIVIKK